MTTAENTGQPHFRDAVDADSWAVIALVGACWSEYPGCVLDVSGECAELLTPASHYRSQGGGFWVVPEGRWLAGCVGLAPGRGQDGNVELVKLYVARHRRRQGLGRALAGLAEDRARARGAGGIELWSDRRFGAAHNLYRALGYRSTGAIRELHDLSRSVEYHFFKSF